MPEAIPIVASVIGGAMGSGGSGGSQSTQREMPSWMNDYVRGGNGMTGLLPSAYGVFNQQMSQGGLNPQMLAGLEAQRQVLASPQYTQGYGMMRGQGMSLMDTPIANNPFSVGYQGLYGGLTPRTGMYGQTPGLTGSLFRPSGAGNGAIGYSANPALAGALNPLSMPSAPPPPAAGPATSGGNTGGAPSTSGGLNSIDQYQQWINYMLQQWLADPGGSGGSGGSGSGGGGSGASPGAGNSSRGNAM